MELTRRFSEAMNTPSTALRESEGEYVLDIGLRCDVTLDQLELESRPHLADLPTIDRHAWDVRVAQPEEAAETGDELVEQLCLL